MSNQMILFLTYTPIQAWEGEQQQQQQANSLPGSMAADISDCASLTRFMASSISLFAASAFSPGFRFSPAAIGFSLGSSGRHILLVDND